MAGKRYFQLSGGLQVGLVRATFTETYIFAEWRSPLHRRFRPVVDAYIPTRPSSCVKTQASTAENGACAYASVGRDVSTRTML